MEALLSEAISLPQKINDETIRTFKATIESNHGRLIFMKKLNNFRSNHNCILQTRDNYNNLCKMMLSLLDEAHK